MAVLQPDIHHHHVRPVLDHQSERLARFLSNADDPAAVLFDRFREDRVDQPVVFDDQDVQWQAILRQAGGTLRRWSGWAGRLMCGMHVIGVHHAKLIPGAPPWQ